jgi:hypothetical protein
MKKSYFCVALVTLSCGFALGQAQEKVLWTFTGTPDGWGSLTPPLIVVPYRFPELSNTTGDKPKRGRNGL